MLYKIQWTKNSKKDYEDLDGSQRIFVDKALNRIRKNGMEAGHPLRGDLKQCNKLKHKKMGLRIIFREVKGRLQVIQIVVIGKRDNDGVYKTAKKRLDE